MTGTWRRPEHAVVAAALAAMDGGWLLANRCFFGGGTAIVLLHGEYRRSLDIDFLCADEVGYRHLREAALTRGIAAFFGDAAQALRDIRSDQYGIRAVLAWQGHAIRFEVIREAHIALDGAVAPRLGVPVLAHVDQCAEKLLANADRALDRAVARRDAFDLGIPARADGGRLPAAAAAKAEAAYGGDVPRKVRLVLEALAPASERHAAAADLGMAASDADAAVLALHAAAARLWPRLALPAIAGAG